MELFYSDNICPPRLVLSQEESNHCVKVLRHRAGDCINVIDGKGAMYECRIISDAPKSVECDIVSVHDSWGGHGYNLTMAVCPTKNNDRYEWFIEKATEIGVDRIVPIIGEHSERKVYKIERAGKIALSAAKQSLKAKIPVIEEPVSVTEFIKKSDASLKMIAWCFEGQKERTSIVDALAAEHNDVVIMIGPEGDFSQREGQLAVEAGFMPIHLGSSRLRTETAAVTAVTAVYLSNK